METYNEQIQKQKDLQTDIKEEEGMYVDTDFDGIHLDLPPESAVDTNSDGICYGLSEGDGDDMDKDYNNNGVWHSIVPILSYLIHLIHLISHLISTLRLFGRFTVDTQLVHA